MFPETSRHSRPGLFALIANGELLLADEVMFLLDTREGCAVAERVLPAFTDQGIANLAAAASGSGRLLLGDLLFALVKEGPSRPLRTSRRSG